MLNKKKFFSGIFALITLGFFITILTELEENNIIVTEYGSIVNEVNASVYATPLKQLSSRISSDNIECSNGLVLVKKNNGSPSCVKSTSIYSLYDRGWIGNEINFNELALTIAKDFVVNGQTFSFDGILHTLDVRVVQIRESYPEQFVIDATFDSRHGGFGDRKGQFLTQVITPHKMTLVVSNGKVISAVIDEKWDELNESPLIIGDDENKLLDLNAFIENAQRLAINVKVQGEVTQPFFSIPGILVNLDGKTIQVYEYSTTDNAKSESSMISNDGTIIGTTIATWNDSPHFFQKENLLVLYLGNDLEIIELLESILGKQIAGKELTFDNFSITYIKEGGFAGIFQKITFDSKDRLIVIEDNAKQTLGPVDLFALEIMLEVLNNSDFFKIESDYPPNEGSADYFTHTLTITSGDLENQVSWADASENVPDDLLLITQEIEQFILDYQKKYHIDNVRS